VHGACLVHPESLSRQCAARRGTTEAPVARIGPSQEWTHQALHGCHHGFKICHDILWRLIQACIHGQQIPDAAVLSGSSAQQADPRFHTPLFHVGKVHLVSKLQPNAASSPGEKIGGDLVVKVDPRHLCSRIQDLQQNVATI